MAVSAAHFKEVTNGYEQTSSGLWTHKGRLNSDGLRVIGPANYPPTGQGLELVYYDSAAQPPGLGIIQPYNRDASAWGDLNINARNINIQPQGGAVTMPANTWTNVTFQGGFGNYGGNWGPCQYTKTVTGMVRFRGLMVAPATTSWGNTTAFTLPAGYGLAIELGNAIKYQHFACIGSTGGGGPYRDGGIIIYNGGAINPWLDSSQGNAA